MDLVLTKRPYYVQSGFDDDNSHYDVLTVECMTDAVALCNQVMRPEAQVHLICFTFQFGQPYIILSGVMEEKESSSDDVEGSATQNGGGKKKAVIELESILLHYNR